MDMCPCKGNNFFGQLLVCKLCSAVLVGNKLGGNTRKGGLQPEKFIDVTFRNRARCPLFPGVASVTNIGEVDAVDSGIPVEECT